jgi:hypothetical protein
MVQDFGTSLDDEPAVIVEPNPFTPRVISSRGALKPLKVILKGFDDTTYACLKDRPDEVAKKEDNWIVNRRGCISVSFGTPEWAIRTLRTGWFIKVLSIRYH